MSNVPEPNTQRAASAEEHAEPKALRDPEIDLLVRRYRRELARYEEAARLSEDRIRRSLRKNQVKALLSSRAKDPEELEGKLKKNRADPRYTFARLNENINDVVTDLAGCRVMLYRNSDIEVAANIVRSSLRKAGRPDDDEVHDKPSGYRATHILVVVDDAEERASLQGAICEVQITSLAAHIYNELEHDLIYKERGITVSDEEREALKELLAATRRIDPVVDRLFEIRRKRISRIDDAEDLRYALEGAADRRLHGDFVDLFSLLSAVVSSVTTAVIEEQGSVGTLLEKGRLRADRLGLAGADDVTRLALALLDQHHEQLASIVQDPEQGSSSLRQVIAQAILQWETLK